MARTVEFSINSLSMTAELKKVDRKKIYGWSKIEVYDENKSKCKLAGLADGTYILPSGSTSLVTLNTKGEIISKKDMVGLDLNGKPVEKVPSVYDKTVMLREATIDEYLSLSVKSVYQLNISENKEDFLKELNSGKIFYFIFNYREDYEGDDAFLLSNGNEIFAITGMLSESEFVGLMDNEKELVIEESEENEDDDLDFAMF
tara:strand:- start:2806 stop:3411 length:606 start_codon:yes stop_codon:yes gene_type:complete